jgi:hypothetical protein
MRRDRNLNYKKLRDLNANGKENIDFPDLFSNGKIRWTGCTVGAPWTRHGRAAGTHQSATDRVLGLIGACRRWLRRVREMRRRR